MNRFRMNHLRRLLDRGGQVIMPSDGEGFTGRECPNSECEGYFKIVFGTGIEEPNTPCHCPYCGHLAQHEHFFTQDQIKCLESRVFREFSEAIRKDLKSLEFEHKPRGAFWVRRIVEAGDRTKSSYSPIPGKATRNRRGVWKLHPSILRLWRVRLLPRLWPT